MKLIKNKDSRNDRPKNQKEGVYIIMKKNIIASFTFGKLTSSFKNIDQAFEAMTEFLLHRKDADKLQVTLLNTHF